MSVAPDEPTRSFATQAQRVDELAIQVRIFEAMFNDPGLARLRRRLPHHPAVRRLDHLELLRTGEPIPAGNELDPILSMAIMQMDRSTWASEPTSTPYWEHLVPDPAQRLQVAKRIGDPDQFEDVLSELFFWGWLRDKGLDADLREDEGMPDIRITLPAKQTWAEVKRLHAGTPATSARRVLKKASHQLHRTGDKDAGPLFLYVERERDTAVFDDKLPIEIAAVVDEVERVLQSGFNTHVCQVVVVWDDVMVLGSPPARSLFAVRRRSVVLAHRTPAEIPVLLPTQLDVGSTFVTWWTYQQRSESQPEQNRGDESAVGGHSVVTDAFRDANAFEGGIRRTHALGVQAAADGSWEADLGGASVVLVTKRIDASARPHVVLLIGYSLGGKPMELSAGFRLHGTDAELEELTSDPLAAFQTLIDRFGLRVRAGDMVGTFIPFATSTGDLRIEVIDGSDGTVSCFFRRVAGVAEASWIFAIDHVRYRESVKS